MTLRQRLWVVGVFAALGLSALAVAKHYSSSMIAYVVEEALVQKLPSGSDPQYARLKFQSLMAEMPDRKVRTERLLSMSQYLEKIQILEPQELDRLLSTGPMAKPVGIEKEKE